MNIGVRDLERKAKYFNDVDAQLELGRRYRYGMEVEMDLGVARDWFEKAARQGNSEARDCLGSMDGRVMNVELLEKLDESTLHEMPEEPAPVETTLPTKEMTALLQDQRSYLLKCLRKRLDLPRLAVPLEDSVPDEVDQPTAKFPHSKSPSRPRRKRRLQKPDVKSAAPATGAPGTRWSLVGLVLMMVVWVFWNWVNDDLRERTAEKLAFNFQRAGKPVPWISADEPLNKGGENKSAEPLVLENENEAMTEEEERKEAEKSAAIDEELKGLYQAESLIYTLVLLSGLMGVRYGLKGHGNLLLGIAALGWWGYDYYTWYAQYGTYWWWFPG